MTILYKLAVLSTGGTSDGGSIRLKSPVDGGDGGGFFTGGGFALNDNARVPRLARPNDTGDLSRSLGKVPRRMHAGRWEIDRVLNVNGGGRVASERDSPNGRPDRSKDDM